MAREKWEGRAWAWERLEAGHGDPNGELGGGPEEKRWTEEPWTHRGGGCVNSAL